MSLDLDRKSPINRKNNSLAQCHTKEAELIEVEVIECSYSDDYCSGENDHRSSHNYYQHSEYWNVLEGFKFLYAVLTKAGGPPVAMLLAYGLVISQISTILLPISLIAAISASCYLLSSAFYFFFRVK